MFRPAIVLALLSFALPGTSAVAASFDCAKAATFQEQTICKSAELSYLDQDMAAHYKVALSTSPHPEQLKEEQRQWLAMRNNCSDAACLQTSMEARISSLQAAYESNTAPSQLADPAPAASAATNQVAPPPSLATSTATGVTLANQGVQAFAQAAQAAKHEAAESVSVTSTSSDTSYSGQQAAEKSYLPLKIAGVVLAIICSISIYLHHQGTLTIYTDFTDATFTSAIPIAAFGVTMLLLFLEVPKPLSMVIGIGSGAVMFLFVLRATIAANGLGYGAALALITKVSIIGAYYLLLITFVFGAPSRRNGEGQAAYERRSRRESRAAVVFLTAVFTGLSAWVCRNRQFSPISEYIAGRTH